jgi:tetratricopeptide (TPR) repeat protein
MRLGSRAVALVVACALMAVVAAYFHYRSSGVAFKPEGGVLFVNETSDHKYDRALRSSIRTFQDRTHIQMGIILKDKLPPLSTIEEYAASTFKKVRLSEGFRGKGILLVWSEQERLFKIETSYELEPIFPDLICHRLEEGARTFMLAKSAFARRDFLTELMVTMGLHYLDYRKTGQLSEMPLLNTEPGQYLTRYMSGGGGIVGRGYAASVEQVQRELVALPTGAEKEMQPDASAGLVVQRYLASLDLGIGAPQLPLLTEGSRYFRMNKPHAPGYLQRIYAYYQKAQPYQIREKGGLAVALFQPGAPVLPILLRKNEQGLWLIDEAKAWVYFHLSEDGSSVPKYSDSPYAFVWLENTDRERARPIYFDRSHTPALIEQPFNLKEKIRSAEQYVEQAPNQAMSYLRLAELLHFEMYWIEAAAPMYEKVLELAPERDDIRWRLIDVYLNMTDIDGLERQYLQLLKNTPDDTLVQYYYKWFQKMYP